MLSSLLRPPVDTKVRIKMCGMTRLDDVLHAVTLGINALGFIFYPKSPRCISIEHAATLLKDLPPFVQVVAVLADPDSSFVHQLLNTLPIDLLQFHSQESADFCKQFNKPFLKAIHPENMEHIKLLTQEYSNAKAILLDTPSKTAKGGTGLTFDWHMIPKQSLKPYILAGGLNQNNVLDAVQMCAPYAVDVSSGIEVSPGIKDPAKMNGFVKALWG